LRHTLRASLGSLTDIVTAHRPDAERAFLGLLGGDPSVWSQNPATQQKIKNRLGWLRSPFLMANSLNRLRAFADAVRSDGFTEVVLLGMGGSSLAPEVFRAVLGGRAGWPRLRVLDSTDPATIRSVTTPPRHTLYILASKSGTTIEPNSLAAHFRDGLERAGVRKWASHFVAITDEGTTLAARAREEQFRETFINPSDIGGRYSALSFFGLVPAVLMGLDVSAIVGWATAMLEAAEAEQGDLLANPAAALGLIMGAAARAGKDKLTLLGAASLEPIGLWVEQLVAESCGKNGVGVVPIAGESPPGATYGRDRLFVHLDWRPPSGRAVPRPDRHHADAPAIAIELVEPAALGAELVRWEIATAIAGALLQVNPFDEPNVQQAKDATQALLDVYQATGQLPVPPRDHVDKDGALTLTSAARNRLGEAPADSILTLLGPGDYLAILAYLGPEPELADALQAFRLAVRDRTGSATMLGMGPRYLHSTGQLHKGGGNNGVFVLITGTPSADLDIPGAAFSFGTLEMAQALGDFASLDTAGRRAVHVHLAAPDARLIRTITDRLLARLPRP
jgi:glucose-6-phosphate isomerase